MSHNVYLTNHLFRIPVKNGDGDDFDGGDDDVLAEVRAGRRLVFVAQAKDGARRL